MKKAAKVQDTGTDTRGMRDAGAAQTKYGRSLRKTS